MCGNLWVVSVSVILVSYNTADLTIRAIECVNESLCNCDFPVDVIVIDNASRDESVARTRAQFPRIKVIESPLNLGFGAANNKAVSECVSDYVLLLNTDAFLQPETLSVLEHYISTHPSVGVVGPTVLNADGSVQTAAWNFPSPIQSFFEYSGIGNLFPGFHIIGGYRNWKHNRTQSVPWLIGACILIRRKLFIDIGGFDSAFFMYAEETDLQKRIRVAGYDIHLCADTQVVHLGGGSGTLESESVRRYFYTSQDLYMRKHFGFVGLLLYRVIFGIFSLARCFAWYFVALVRGKSNLSSKQKAELYAYTALRSLTKWSMQ
jgi:N-acetylglucosaminyl-diphospho-decaprenol L-rhamnosyltransferase